MLTGLITGATELPKSRWLTRPYLSQETILGDPALYAKILTLHHSVTIFIK